VCRGRQAVGRTGAAQQTSAVVCNQQKSEEIRRNEKNQKKSEGGHPKLAFTRKPTSKLTLLV